MANNYGVANTVFKPFSFEEMLRPALMATKYLEDLEKEKLIADEAAALSALDFKDSNYENQFNQYTQLLTNVTDLINKGDLHNAKNSFKKARSMYINTLEPARQRIKRLNALRDEQNKKQEANPLIRFSVDFRDKTEDDINTNSNYVSYDLNKIYAQVAQNTVNKISKDFRPQVGTPVGIKGTNLISIMSGYGMTPQEYEAAVADKNSDLNKFINEQIKLATNGITNKEIIDEVTQGVKDTIKNNIGKFTPQMQQRPQYSNANAIRQREFNYKYTKDDKGNYRLSDNYISDQMTLKGYVLNDGGEWVKPSGSDNLLPPDKSYDPELAYNIPELKGKSVRVKTFDVDNKLNNKDSYVDVNYNGKATKANKYTHSEILSANPKGVSEEILIDLVGGDSKLLPYYDFYYVDDNGRGGTIYSELKKDKDIKYIQNKTFINEQISQNAKGIARIENAYYYVDSNNRILLDKNKKGIRLSKEEVLAYKDLISGLGNKEIVSIDSSQNVTL
jgi:hypothetical protein